jgi:hypothetical protein
VHPLKQETRAQLLIKYENLQAAVRS